MIVSAAVLVGTNISLGIVDMVDVALHFPRLLFATFSLVLFDIFSSNTGNCDPNNDGSVRVSDGRRKVQTAILYLVP